MKKTNESLSSKARRILKNSDCLIVRVRNTPYIVDSIDDLKDNCDAFINHSRVKEKCSTYFFLKGSKKLYDTLNYIDGSGYSDAIMLYGESKER